MVRTVGALVVLVAIAALVPVDPTAAATVESLDAKGIGQLKHGEVHFPQRPPPRARLEKKLDYCERVLAELEMQLPRKSLFRWHFADRARLSSGFEKEFKFAYESNPYQHLGH